MNWRIPPSGREIVIHMVFIASVSSGHQNCSAMCSRTLATRKRTCTCTLGANSDIFRRLIGISHPYDKSRVSKMEVSVQKVTFIEKYKRICKGLVC